MLYPVFPIKYIDKYIEMRASPLYHVSDLPGRHAFSSVARAVAAIQTINELAVESFRFLLTLRHGTIC